MSPGFASRHARALVLSAGVASAWIFAWGAWAISDHMEADNEFCVSCHLDPETPLHAVKAREFRSAPAPNLVAAHLAAGADFRCIDCHGGASFLNKLRVKSVAARDLEIRAAMTEVLGARSTEELSFEHLPSIKAEILQALEGIMGPDVISTIHISQFVIQ